MPVAKCTVLYVNPPRPGAKKATIKTDTLGIVGVWPDKLNEFQRGLVYEIEYKENNFNGKTYKDFVRMAGPPPGYAPQQQYTPPPKPYSGNGQEIPESRENAEYAARNQPRPPPQQTLPEDKQGKSIFVTGVVGRAMQSGEFHADDIARLTAAASEAYDAMLRGSLGQKQNGGDPRGDIPPPNGRDEYGQRMDDDLSDVPF